MSGGTGMGSRIREDNGRGWIPVCVFTGASCERGDGDGFPHPRGQREGKDFRSHLYEGGLYEGITEGVGRASTRDAPIGERGEEMG